MQILKVAKLEYISARKENKSLDYYSVGYDTANYYYCSFEKNKYALEELADLLTEGKKSVVLFYLPRTNSLAIVFAYCDIETKFINLEEKTPINISLLLKWYALCTSADNEIIVANNMPSDFTKDILSGIKFRTIGSDKLLSASKSSSKMLSGTKRVFNRVLILIILALSLTSNTLMKHPLQKLEENLTDREALISSLKKETLYIEKQKSLIQGFINNKEQYKELTTQSISGELVSLKQVPKAIIIKNGHLEQN